MGQSTRAATVLRIAAAIDLLIALFLAFTPFLASRVGRPVALAIAGVMGFGALTLFFLAGRLAPQGTGGQ